MDDREKKSLCGSCIRFFLILGAKEKGNGSIDTDTKANGNTETNGNAEADRNSGSNGNTGTYNRSG